MRKSGNKYILWVQIMAVALVCLFFSGAMAFAEMDPKSCASKQESPLDDSIFRETLRAAMICKLIEKRAKHEKAIEDIALRDVFLWKELNERESEECILERRKHEIRIYLPKSNLCIRYCAPDFDRDSVFIPNASIVSIKTYAISEKLTKQIIFYTAGDLPTEKYDAGTMRVLERMLRMLLRPYSLLNIKKQDI